MVLNAVGISGSSILKAEAFNAVTRMNVTRSSQPVSASAAKKDRRARVFLQLVAGVLALFVSLALDTITVAPPASYSPVLIAALVFIVLADLCFIAAFRRSGDVIRTICVVCMLPTVFIVLDSIGRLSRSVIH